jgi:pimeloyl-ACP methyl ester carboxylesterase
MTDQIGSRVPGGAVAAANGGDGAASGRRGPVPRWPGRLISLRDSEIFVRNAPRLADGHPPGADPADGERTVFVHGLGGSSVNWTDLMALLCQPAITEAGPPPLACEALDLPGFGFSPAPADEDYSVDARAAAVIELIESGSQPVHLVGNSLGGAIGTRIASRRPDLVRTLTLISPALPDLRPRLLPIRLALISMPGIGRLILDRLLQLPPERRADRSINELYADPSLMEPERRAEAVSEVIRRDALGYSSDVLIGSSRALVAEYTRRGPGTLWQDAAEVAAPTLVIHGSHDRLVDPANAGRAARTFRNCRVVVLPRIGHVAMMERPDLVAMEMRDFFASTRSRRVDAVRSGR